MKKIERGLTPEGFDLGYRGAEFKEKFEALQKELGLRLQIGWRGKHAYVQLVDSQSPSEHAVTILKVSKDGRTRWVLDSESSIPVRYERAHCHECFAVLCEVKK